MIVKRTKGMTLAIRIFSILVIPVLILFAIASIDYIIKSKDHSEMTQWIFFFLLFFMILILNLLLTIKAYKRNPTVLKIDGDKLIIYLGYPSVL